VTRPVGFVGLGAIGAPMARRLLAWPGGLWVHDVDPEATARLREAGALVADSVTDLAGRVGLLCVMVRDDDQVRQVLDSALDARPDDLVVAVHSTVAPGTPAELAGQAHAVGVRLLDAPVSGGPVGAAEGTLAIMVGGDAADVETARPLFEAMGQRITHCGPLGAGQTVKLCNQVAIGGALLGVCEALTFAQKNGVDPAVVIEAISAGAAGSWQLSNLGPRMLKRDFAPGFKVGLMRKDLRLAMESAQQQDMALPGLALVAQLFAAVAAAGGEDQGTQALLTSLEALNRVTVEHAGAD